MLARTGAASLLTATLSDSVLLDLSHPSKAQPGGNGAMMECFSWLPQLLLWRTHHSHITRFARLRARPWDHGGENPAPGLWETLPKWPGWRTPPRCWAKAGCTPASRRLSATQRLRLPKYSATACIQQISTEHHHYLMLLWSMKILFWAVSHKTILLVQPFISLSSLKLDTWDPNQQNIFYMCMEFRQSFRYKIYVFFSLSLGPSQFTQLVTVLEHLGRQWKNSEKKSLFWEYSVSRHFWTSFNKELL